MARNETRRELAKLGNVLRRPASVAAVGGFRPPDDPLTSWFGRGVARTGEGPPAWDGAPMVPIVQICVRELPFVPDELRGTAMLVLFFASAPLPFGRPHGEGWCIRAYPTLDGLAPLAIDIRTLGAKPLPIRWSRVDDDAPSWDDAAAIVDFSRLDTDDDLSEVYPELHRTHPGTKVGGWPSVIQGEAGTDGFVFQVDSDEKARWQWVHSGVAHFFRDEDGWRWGCQFL